MKVLTGHTGSVLCLQYDENVTVTGSSDSTVRYDKTQFLHVIIIHAIHKLSDKTIFNISDRSVMKVKEK